MIGRPSAITGTTIATAVPDFVDVLMLTMARTNPRNMLPVSPMKMVAGLKLKTRKPSTAPASAAMHSAISTSPRASARTRFVPAAKKATPPARPSSPSMRLTAFTTPTIHRSVNGSDSIPSGIGGPKGQVMLSIRRPTPHMASATANWTVNFSRAPHPRKSS